MSSTPASAVSSRLVFHVRYVKNKYHKQPLRVTDTRQIAEACPICGGPLEDLTRVVNRAREAIIVRSACWDCGFSTFSQMPDRAWFEDFYRSSWDRRRTAEEIAEKLQTPYAKLIELIRIAGVPAEAAILDIGAGYGGALYQLRGLGYTNLVGTEASAKRCDYGRDILGLDLALCTAEQLLEAPSVQAAAPYDLIYSWHVFEHIYDIDTALRNFRALLKPGGALCLGVPHFRQEHLIRLAHFLPHIHSFTPHALERLLRTHGFALRYIDDEIRVVAVKLNELPALAPHLVPRGGRDEFGRTLRAKIAQDFDLETLTVGPWGRERAAEVVCEYHSPVTVSASEGRVTIVESLTASQRFEIARKKLILGPGTNRRPILRPFQASNALDPRCLARAALARTVRFAAAEVAGVAVLNPAGGPDPDNNDFSRIEFVYPDDWGYGWVK